MGLNVKNKTTYHFVDDNGLVMNQDELLNPDQLNARGDTIGHTVNAYFAYGYKPFVRAVKNCFRLTKDKKETYYQGYRSPYHFKHKPNTMSRDHIIYTLVLLKYVGDPFLKTLSKKLRWKISERYSFTIDSWLWMKGISGNKLAMFLFYLIEISIMFISVIWNKIITIIGRLDKEVPQDDFVLIPKDKINKRKMKYDNLLYPVYAYQTLAFKLYVSNKSFGRWLLNKICLMDISKENYLLRIMFGGKVDEKLIYSYKPMIGGRWSTKVNNNNDRYLRINTDPISTKENNVDVDLLRTIYRNIKKK